MNGLVNKKLVMDAWVHLRKTNSSIPDETLDFMRDVSLTKLEQIRGLKCSMKSQMPLYMDTCTFHIQVQPANKTTTMAEVWQQKINEVDFQINLCKVSDMVKLLKLSRTKELLEKALSNLYTGAA